MVFFLAGLTQGLADIGPREVWAALVNPQDTAEHHLIRGVRMPRAVIGMLAGSALAVAGALLQTVTKNPLASAGTFGINAGAFFVVVAGTVFFPGFAHRAPLALALAGGCLAALFAYAMAGGRKGTPVRMALSGMIVSLVLSSFTGMLQLFFENETGGLFVWGSGMLQQNDWSGVQYAWPWVLLCLAAAFMMAPKLDVLDLGDDTARSLGQRVGGLRLAALASAVLLAAVTVSVVGPIGFVGLIAPHLVRLMGLRRHIQLLPVTAIWGAAVLTGADAAARLFVSSLGELPAGAVTAAIGAPWLIWLAIRESGGRANPEGRTSMSIGAVNRRLPYAVWVAGSALLLGGALIAGLMGGSVRLSVSEVAAVLAGGGEELSRHIVLQLRMPRELTAALAGALLAVSGAMLQGTVRNPLADPSVIGVTSGAGAGALLLLTVWPGASGQLLPAAAITGAFAAAGIVYLLSWRKGFQPAVLTLVGIAVSAAGAAAIQLLVIKSSLTAAPALAWLAGSTYARGWSDFRMLAAAAVVLLPASWAVGRHADLLAFGDSVSVGLGLRLRRTRLMAAGLGVAAAAMAVASVGTVGFIGLLGPHAARLCVGQHHKRLVVLSALFGAIMLLLADLVGKTVIAPKEIPSGLVAALIGTPYLLMLMRKSSVK